MGPTDAQRVLHSFVGCFRFGNFPLFHDRSDSERIGISNLVAQFSATVRVLQGGHCRQLSVAINSLSR